MTNRIFVPLNGEAYAWFESGIKKWELRRVRGQYTEKHIRPGRMIELRKGYRPGSSLWGTVKGTTIAAGLVEFFSKVPFAEVVPSAKSQEEAIAIAERILRVLPGSLDEVIGIEVGEVSPNSAFPDVRTSMAQKIPISSNYVPLVQSGRKVTTVRKGYRKVDLGKAEFVSGPIVVPVTIQNVEYKKYHELTDEDAVRDGFANLGELTQALRKFYPSLGADDLVTIISFRLQ